jgi:hypothetical protein
MKRFSEHIEFEKLVAQAEGAFVFDDVQTNHLADCRLCMSRARRMGNFFAVAAKKDFAQVPQFVTANLLNVYRKPQPAEKKSALKRFFGSLIFDDWQPEFAVQERLSFLETRQLLYRAERYEIDLRLNFVDGKCQVIGQIFPDCETGKINIFSQNTAVETELNEHCEFVLPVIEEGVYNLEAEFDGELIEIQNLPLLS